VIKFSDASSTAHARSDRGNLRSDEGERFRAGKAGDEETSPPVERARVKPRQFPLRVDAMINQMELVGAVFQALDRQGVKTLCTRQMSAVIRAVNDIIEECERDVVMTSPGMGLTAWLASDDVGMSSRYMASVLGGLSSSYAHPYDLDDFGRCSRLLIAVPEFRQRLGLMRDKSPEWGGAR
jgi:hypothetical protein